MANKVLVEFTVEEAKALPGLIYDVNGKPAEGM
jgi:hypothetical protein